MSDPLDLARRVVFYGRRKGRRLRGPKTRLMEELLPRLQIAAASTPLDLAALFPGKQEFWLEIGFGGGEHLAARAAEKPDAGFIGCEPFVNGVASMLEHVERRGLTNIRILMDDARPFLQRLPDRSISGIYLLFADPWPKKRHADRRFIGPHTLPELARVMKPGAHFYAASDEPPLQEWMLEHLRADKNFIGAEGTENGIYPARPDWPQTRYETKALAKKKFAEWTGAKYFAFRRV